MVGKILALALALTAAAGASPAHASNNGVTMKVAATEEVVWVQAGTSLATVETLEIEVFAPRGDGRRRALWQRCTFTYSGPGAYMCGIDADDVAATEGRWIARTSIGGNVVDKIGFWSSPSESDRT